MRFIDRFSKYCLEKGTTPHKVAQEVGEDTTLVSSWMNGKRTPTIERMLVLLQNFAESRVLDIDFETLSAWWAADFLPPGAFHKGSEEAKQNEARQDRRSS